MQCYTLSSHKPYNYRHIVKMLFFRRSCPIEIVKLRKGQWKTSRFMTKQLCNLKESSQGHISSFLRDSNLPSFFSFPLNRNLTFFFWGGGGVKKIWSLNINYPNSPLVGWSFCTKKWRFFEASNGVSCIWDHRTFQTIQNGGTEPCKAIWGMGFPLHRPYIQLIYSRWVPPF